VFFRRLTIIFIYALGGVGVSTAQILDDTTKVVYGALSTMYLKEYDLRFDVPEHRYIDTTIFNSYKKSMVELSNYQLSNLGLEGTTLRTIYYQVPTNIGVSPGFNGFSWFFKRPEDIMYYNTRAPYSRLSIFLGGGNRSITDVEFTRSDSVTFNMGFAFRKMAIDKQVQRLGRGDKRADDTQYDIYTLIRSKNLKYQLLSNFSRTKHIYFESGGVDTTNVGDFFDKDVGVNLLNASSQELRRNIHLYHQYSIKDFLEVYNSIDWYSQINQYIDDPIDKDRDFYDTLFISQTETLDSTAYNHFQYEVGLKGRINQVYYNAFIKNRYYNFFYKYAVDSTGFGKHISNPTGEERYYGFHLGYILPNYHVTGGAEYLDENAYKMYFSAIGKNLDVKYNHYKYKPSFLQQAYMGNSVFWINNFSSSSVDNIRAKYYFSYGPAVVAPTIGYDLILDYIFFDENRLPAQVQGEASILSPGLELRVNFFKRFQLDGNVIYSIVSREGGYAFQIPKLFVNTRLFYNNFFFNKNLELNTGIDVNYKSAYFGYNYMPEVQQFYLQNEVLTEGEPIITLFVNFKINRVRFTLKMDNLKAFVSDKGYMIAPLYTGTPPRFDFGLTWWFFD